MNQNLAIEQRQLGPLAPVVWFNEQTELRSVAPYVATESDVWVATPNDTDTDGIEGIDDIHALALVEDGEVHRLGVAPENRRQGIASAIIERLLDEYGELELVCRESLEANKFYAATGWEKVGVRYGDPEDLIEWRLTDVE